MGTAQGWTMTWAFLGAWTIRACGQAGPGSGELEPSLAEAEADSPTYGALGCGKGPVKSCEGPNVFQSFTDSCVSNTKLGIYPLAHYLKLWSLGSLQRLEGNVAVHPRVRITRRMPESLSPHITQTFYKCFIWCRPGDKHIPCLLML